MNRSECLAPSGSNNSRTNTAARTQIVWKSPQNACNAFLLKSFENHANMWLHTIRCDVDCCASIYCHWTERFVVITVAPNWKTDSFSQSSFIAYLCIVVVLVRFGFFSATWKPLERFMQIAQMRRRTKLTECFFAFNICTWTSSINWNTLAYDCLMIRESHEQLAP